MREFRTTDVYAPTGDQPRAIEEIAASIEDANRFQTVLGATGTVGQVAVQAARLLGADRVVAAGRDRGRLERVLRLGADEIVHLGDCASAKASFTWPRICGSPTIIESRLAATRKT